MLTALESALPGERQLAGPAHRRRLEPIADNGNYLLLQITSRHPDAVRPGRAAVAMPCEERACGATQKAIDLRRAPRLGQRRPAVRRLGPGRTPPCSRHSRPTRRTCSTPTANVGPSTAPASVSGSTLRAGSSVPSAAEHAAPPPRHGGGPRAGRCRPVLPATRGRADGGAAGRAGPSCARRGIRRPPASRASRAFDHLYEAAATFEEVYAACRGAGGAAAAEAAPAGVVYAVPGSPLVAERTVDLLRADPRVEVTIVPALSFLDLAWVAPRASTRWRQGVRLVDAGAFEDLAAGERRPAPGGAVLVPPPALRDQARRVPDDDRELPRPVLLHHLGLEDEQVLTVGWWDLDRTLEPDHLTSLYIPPSPRPTPCGRAEVARLAPWWTRCAQQCPWDRCRRTRR